MTPQVHCSFSLTGGEDFDPEDFTATTGLAPTKSWRVGELSRGRVRQHSFWCFELGPDSTLDQSEQVERLIGLIEPHAQAITQLVDAHGVEPQIELWWSVPGSTDSTPGLHFRSELLRRVVALGADIDIGS